MCGDGHWKRYNSGTITLETIFCRCLSALFLTFKKQSVSSSFKLFIWKRYRFHEHLQFNVHVHVDVDYELLRNLVQTRQRGAVMAQGSSGGSLWGAVVAHWGSRGGSFVVTPDCETVVLALNPAISPAYSGLPVLRWAAIWDGTLL
jgi:hypothetical protein